MTPVAFHHFQVYHLIALLTVDGIYTARHYVESPAAENTVAALSRHAVCWSLTLLISKHGQRK